ncbi:hypothetical protein [Oerskovia jenensis]|uniref:hypothetical protein n=1 Tax=Oerskovia jenensis TaxID=162169 RepID=UPI0036DF4B1B
MASIDQARDAKAALKRALAGHDGVTGIGLTRGPADAAGGAGAPAAASQDAETPGSLDDTWCLQVNVVDTDARHEVPHEVDGVAVVVRVTGHVGAG